MTEFWQGMANERRVFEEFLKNYFLAKFGDTKFSNIIAYSLLSVGGKRIRPLLLLSTARANKGDLLTSQKFAVAIECIHTYSLIHDDLPCMDNDTYRRGILTSHAKYGEADALLAGDALLNFAYESIFDNDVFNESKLKAARIISSKAGFDGMIKGQIFDMENYDLSATENTDNKKRVYEIHLNKTAALIRAAITAGAVLGKAKDSEVNKLDKYALNMGLCYQILDDISDFDSEPDKLTYPKVYGKTEAYNLAMEHKSEAINALLGLENKYSHLIQFINNLDIDIFS